MRSITHFIVQKQQQQTRCLCYWIRFILPKAEPRFEAESLFEKQPREDMEYQTSNLPWRQECAHDIYRITGNEAGQSEAWRAWERGLETGAQSTFREVYLVYRPLHGLEVNGGHWYRPSCRVWGLIQSQPAQLELDTADSCSWETIQATPYCLGPCSEELKDWDYGLDY